MSQRTKTISKFSSLTMLATVLAFGTAQAERQVQTETSAVGEVPETDNRADLRGSSEMPHDRLSSDAILQSGTQAPANWVRTPVEPMDGTPESASKGGEIDSKPQFEIQSKTTNKQKSEKLESSVEKRAGCPPNCLIDKL